MSTQLTDSIKLQMDELLNQSGGRRKSKKASKKVSKKSSKKISKKISKKTSKKPSKKMSKKTSKKMSKKGSKKQKGGINPAMQALLDFNAFIAADSGLKRGVPMVKLVSFLVKKAKAKDPSLTSITAVDEAKKLYLADKSGAVAQYKTFLVKPAAKAEVAQERPTGKKASKKASKKVSKKTSKKASKKASKKTSKK